MKETVKKIAVENFLASLSSNPNKAVALLNLGMDAKQYKWNAATVNAIKKGIYEYYSGKKISFFETVV